MEAGSRPSSTAEAAAAIRAVESLLPPEERLFEDPFAEYFLKPWQQRIIGACRKNRTLREMVVRAVDLIYPGVPADFIVRTKYLDDQIRSSIDTKKVDRLVIIGAGYDTRALRLEDAARLTVTEIDHPATQSHKRRVIERLERAAAHIEWVPYDLSQFAGGATAPLDLFDGKERVIWLLEGIVGYLPGGSVRALLKWIAARSAPGSTLLITYVHRSWIDGSAADLSARRIMRSLARRGEPFVSGFSPQSLREECDRIGIQIQEDISEAECAERYPAFRDRRLHLLAGFRLARGEIL